VNWLERIAAERVIAVVRAATFRQGYEMARAVAAGGMGIIEITADTERAWELIDRLRGELPDCAIGTGTILTLADWQAAASSGAQFMFSPHLDRVLLEKSRAIDLPMIPGAFSPTEIVMAWQAGAASVKVFPVNCLGGAAYLRALREPLAGIPLIPTGGVNLENARGFLEVGAIGVGLGSSLFLPELMERGDWEGVTELARRLRGYVQFSGKVSQLGIPLL
jgi:2-dehydro-3-deoxyphosphogluconate aldolase / (4S)-4-hydroxy-2-oxoglutarate aldolase